MHVMPAASRPSARPRGAARGRTKASRARRRKATQAPAASVRRSRRDGAVPAHASAAAPSRTTRRAGPAWRATAWRARRRCPRARARRMRRAGRRTPARRRPARARTSRRSRWAAAGATSRRARCAPTPSGYVPGRADHRHRRCWARASRGCRPGETGFDLGGGTFVQFSGIPEGKHNVLRDLQESPLGKKANQLESMTIELVAMLFDFIFETKDLPDGIKALLARLQIPVLKAAMLDGAFFAKKTHPSRLLVNALARGRPRLVAGDGARTIRSTADRRDRPPDSRRLHRRSRRSSTSCARSSRRSSPRRRRRPRRTSSRPPRRSTRATAADRAGASPRRRSSGASRCTRSRSFLASFLRQHWSATLEDVYLQQGEESEAWEQSVATLEDLVWSVQPKRTREDRQHLVALLPSLLKRLSVAHARPAPWTPEERERVHVEPGRGACGGGEAVGRHGGARRPPRSPSRRRPRPSWRRRRATRRRRPRPRSSPRR